MDIFSATPGCAHESCVFAGRTDPLLQIHTEHRKFQTFNGSITNVVNRFTKKNLDSIVLHYPGQGRVIGVISDVDPD